MCKLIDLRRNKFILSMLKIVDPTFTVQKVSSDKYGACKVYPILTHAVTGLTVHHYSRLRTACIIAMKGLKFIERVLPPTAPIPSSGERRKGGMSNCLSDCQYAIRPNADISNRVIGFFHPPECATAFVPSHQLFGATCGALELQGPLRSDLLVDTVLHV